MIQSIRKMGKIHMENGNFGGGGNNPNNNNNNNGDNNRNNGGRNNRNGQMVMMFVLITLVALLFMSLISKWQTQMTAREISYTEFLQMVDEGRYDEIALLYKSALYRKAGFFAYEDEGGLFEAELYDILANGHLVLRRREGGLSEYAFKEVKYIID